ncbi:MAG: cysteine desulfurase family protein [Bacillota bacterium]|nr:cysteine desulfurase family protein [Bacillota bacterium]
MQAYLDNAATTRVLPEVAEMMREIMVDHYGNPSSLHRLGLEAEKLVNQARERLAAVLGCTPAEVIFTAGGTEANALAIRGTAWMRHAEGRHLVTTRIEHPSVLQTCRMLEQEGWEATYLDVDASGTVDLAQLERALRPTTVLVTVHYVNNEVGTVQPISAIAGILGTGKRRPWLHVDAVQALGKLPVAVPDLGADLMSLSAHKVHGPKGTGALYARRGIRLRPLLAGGEQEFGLRAGTENVAGIAGFGLAAQLAEQSRPAAAAHMRCLKAEMGTRLTSEVAGCRVNGPPPEQGAPHILNLRLPGMRGETMVHYLEERGVYVSTTSACASRRHPVSHVLVALGLSEEEAACSLRISLSRLNSLEEVTYAIGLIRQGVSELGRFRGR